MFISLLYMMYLVYFTSNVGSAIVASYVGYFFLINLPGVPAAVYIVFNETAQLVNTVSSPRKMNGMKISEPVKGIKVIHL